MGYFVTGLAQRGVWRRLAYQRRSRCHAREVGISMANVLVVVINSMKLVLEVLTHFQAPLEITIPSALNSPRSNTRPSRWLHTHKPFWFARSSTTASRSRGIAFDALTSTKGSVQSGHGSFIWLLSSQLWFYSVLFNLWSGTDARQHEDVEGAGGIKSRGMRTVLARPPPRIMNQAKGRWNSQWAALSGNSQRAVSCSISNPSPVWEAPASRLGPYPNCTLTWDMHLSRVPLSFREGEYC